MNNIDTETTNQINSRDAFNEIIELCERNIPEFNSVGEVVEDLHLFFEKNNLKCRQTKAILKFLVATSQNKDSDYTSKITSINWDSLLLLYTNSQKRLFAIKELCSSLLNQKRPYKKREGNKKGNVENNEKKEKRKYRKRNRKDQDDQDKQEADNIIENYENLKRGLGKEKFIQNFNNRKSKMEILLDLSESSELSEDNTYDKIPSTIVQDSNELVFINEIPSVEEITINFNKEINEKLEAERIAKEEAERIAKEEAAAAERIAKEEAERIAKEEAERIAKEEAEKKRIAKEERDLKIKLKKEAIERAQREMEELVGEEEE
jgi:hypothetical protein